MPITDQTQPQLSAWLKELREQHDLTLRDLAKAVGLSFSVIHSYESGSRRPPLDRLLNILEHYGLTKADIPAPILDELKSDKSYNYQKVTTHRAAGRASPAQTLLHYQVLTALTRHICDRGLPQPSPSQWQQLIEAHERLQDSRQRVAEDLGMPVPEVQLEHDILETVLPEK